MKKTVCILLSLILALTTLPAMGGVTAAADGYTNNSGVGASGMTPHYVKWTLYQDRTLYLYPDNTSITRYLESGDDDWAGQIWFPDAGAMVKMNGKDIVEHLVVASGVDNIYSSMFSGYPNLKTVTLAGMTRIEPSAFSSCPQLESVTVNGSLRSIGARAFADCAALETFTATGIVETIAERAFCNNDGSSLSNDVSLTAFHALSIGQVGNSAFKNCSALLSVSPIRGSVAGYAFWGTNLANTVADPVLFVSGHSGTIGISAFPEGTNLCYTGTEEEFLSRYTNLSRIDPWMQRLGKDVQWSYDPYLRVLDIYGSGRTIDLLEINEQPWANVPDAGSPDDQRDAIARVKIDLRVTCGTHVLDGLENKIEPHYRLTVVGGTDRYYFNGNLTGSYFKNDPVTITANAPEPGKLFKEWSGTDGLQFIESNASDAEAVFYMPARDLTITATYETGYTLTVQNGSGGGLYPAGASVTLTANAAPNGQQFKEWSGISSSWIISGSKTTPTVTFRMPSYNHVVFATYENLYSLTVTNGSGSGSYAAGASVSVTADPAPEHRQFLEWLGADGLTFTSGSRYTPAATFVMPGQNTNLTASYTDILYPVTVENGTGTGSYAYGAPVTVTANPPTEGWRFKEWLGADGLNVTSGSAADLSMTFTMPDSAVALTAKYYDPAAVRTVTVSASGNGTAYASAASGTYGTQITLTAEPDFGYGLQEWQVLSGGVTVTGNTFTIGTDDVEIRAVFAAKPDYRLELPELVTVTPNTVFTPVTVRVPELSMIPDVNGKTPDRLRIAFGAGTLTHQQDSSKTLAFESVFDFVNVPNENIVNFTSPESKTSYLRIAGDRWSTAAPGTYTGSIPYRVFWIYTDKSTSKTLESGSIPVTVTIPAPGDVDSDGEVDLADVTLLTRYLAGGWNVTLDETVADVNDDLVVDLKDVVLIRRFLAEGWDVELV